MQNHNTPIEEPNTTNTNRGEAANLEGIKTCYEDSSFLITGCQMGEISTLVRLIGFCRQAM
jgi:hypothetical protein